jgi:uncharacterized iron-regulated membrane protein
MRLILLLHRCLSVVVGLLMTVWCLSGAVMIYVPYPRLTAAERLAGLTPLDLTHCCRVDGLGIADPAKVDRFSLTMAAGVPVLRLTTVAGGTQAFDLTEGREIGLADAERAAAVATEFVRRRGVQGAARPPQLIDRDQWTVSMEGGPFWRVAFAGGAVVYVRQATGEVAQETTRGERALNWVGAVPHWLYPAMLRQNETLWRQAVAVVALLAAFLTVTGICVSVARLHRPASDGAEASRLDHWHHNLGLVFGLLALIWLGSGLAWAKLGALPSRPPAIDGRKLLAGSPMTWRQVRPMLAAAPQLEFPVAAVEASGAPFGGHAFMSVRSPGQHKRYDARGEIFGPDMMQISAVLSARNGPGLESLIQLNREDGYYFGLRQPMRLPVWRAVLRDRDHTRLYIDQTSGVLLRQVNASDRAYRWWHQGLHRLDFNTGLRRRPLWDVVLLMLLAGVAAMSVLGAWISLRQIARGRQGPG